MSSFTVDNCRQTFVWVVVIQLLCCISVQQHGFVEGLSRPFVEITNPIMNSIEKLPTSFVSNWPTWVLLTDDNDNNSNSNIFVKIPDETDIVNDSAYVNPVSIDELWQPIDLIQPNCNLAIGLHVRDGVIRHVMPAIDLSYNHEHRNRGLCTVPRAYRWMDFTSTQVYPCIMQLQIKSSNEDESNNDDDELWETLLEINSIQKVLETAATAIAEYPPTEIGDGSCIVHVLVPNNNIIECPKPGNDLRVILVDNTNDNTGTIFGQLQVTIKKTAAGSESDYLPQVYKKLYYNDELRRPAYTEVTKRRMAK